MNILLAGDAFSDTVTPKRLAVEPVLANALRFGKPQRFSTKKLYRQGFGSGSFIHYFSYL